MVKQRCSQWGCASRLLDLSARNVRRKTRSAWPPSEVVAYPTMKFSQRSRPSADGGRFEGPILREHGAPFLVPTEGYFGYDLTDAVVGCLGSSC